jgi:glyoxylase I family protein
MEPIPDLRLDHVALSVPDLDAAIGFYSGVLGLVVERRKTWCDDPRMDAILDLPGSAGRQAVLSDGHFSIELWEFTSPSEQAQDPDRPASRPGISHLAVVVRNIAEMHSRLSTAGARFHTPPLTGPTGTIATYARDPFGNIVELVQRP